MSSLEFWSGAIAVFVIQFANMYMSYQARKAGAPLTNAQADSAIGDALDKLAQAYSKLLDTVATQDKELGELRPVSLKIAMQEQAMQQTAKDKEDWKKYSQRLSDQLEEHNILPLPFRRTPPNGDSQPRIKAITKDQIEAMEKENKT